VVQLRSSCSMNKTVVLFAVCIVLDAKYGGKNQGQMWGFLYCSVWQNCGHVPVPVC
jgi:hypothetical protein